MLKKGYTGFILWLLAFTAAIFLIPLLPTDDAGLLTRIICVFSAIAIVLLMVMIYASEKVFWINGVSYEDAAAAGSARRKRYALQHLMRFGVFTAGYVVFAVLAQILGWNLWIDLGVFTVGMVATAVSTVRIRL